MNVRRSLRHLCSTLRAGSSGGVGARGRGGSAGDHSQFLITPEAAKADVEPIDRAAIVPEYLERHKDSDYGFQVRVAERNYYCTYVGLALAQIFYCFCRTVLLHLLLLPPPF